MLVNLAGEQQMGPTQLEEYGQNITRHTLLNYLELKAIHLAIKAYSNLWKRCKYIRIRSDNTKAVTYINSMEGLISSSCDKLAKKYEHIVLKEIPGCQQSIYQEKKIMKQTICSDCLTLSCIVL